MSALVENKHRIYFRPLCWDDLSDIHYMNSQFEVAQYNTLGIPKNIEFTRNVLAGVLDQSDGEPISRYGWTVRKLGTDQFMGEVGISLSEARYRKAVIFYNLLPGFWGRGFGTEAAMFLLKYGFENLKLHRIEAGAATENIASLKVLEKIGMQREGRGIKILPIDGNWQDNFAYAILEEDYFKI